jgi:hypothetical protein
MLCSSAEIVNPKPKLAATEQEDFESMNRKQKNRHCSMVVGGRSGGDAFSWASAGSGGFFLFFN